MRVGSFQRLRVQVQPRDIIYVPLAPYRNLNSYAKIITSIFVKDGAVDALKDLACEYVALKGTAVPHWLKIGAAIRDNPDFVAAVEATGRKTLIAVAGCVAQAEGEAQQHARPILAPAIAITDGMDEVGDDEQQADDARATDECPRHAGPNPLTPV